MIEKMKYINIMGPIDDLDRVIEKYISGYDIQLEYTAKELANERELYSFTAPNPYTPFFKKAEALVKMTGTARGEKDTGEKSPMTKEEAIEVIEFASDYFLHFSEDLKNIKEQRDNYQKALDEIAPFIDLDFNVEDLGSLEFINYQFGRMPISSFKQFEAFLYKDPEILLVYGRNDGDYLWGVYFAADFLKDKVDSVFSSLHFEKHGFPLSVNSEKLTGSVKHVYGYLSEKIKKLDEAVENAEKSIIEQADLDSRSAIRTTAIEEAYHKMAGLVICYETRKYAARTSNDFYIFVGWMTEKDARKMEKGLEDDEKVVFIIEDDNESIISKPPTKLKNLPIFSPFEFFVKMYGLPSYNEIDPTPLLAITYTLLFGVMFGDVGQGAVLILLGMGLWFFKKMELGKIMGIIGCASMVFGVLFGSFFGYEFNGLWMHPAESENINPTLMYAVVFGVVLIIVPMLVNIINAFRKKQLVEALFNPNGFAGIIFYVAVLAVVLSMLTGAFAVAEWIIIVFIVIPLIFIAFREPLIRMLKRKKERLHGGIPLFILETVIELFEVMLSYFTNTVSFVRVGAFALSHASIMGVVWMLSRNAGNSIIIVIFGNLLVIALEGLIAGIQALRLEFYEMFSRFYEGNGREFLPYKNNTGLKNKI